jgi:hypothetical protein
VNAYRKDKAPRREAHWAYWGHNAKEAAGWCWEAIKPYAGAVAIIGVSGGILVAIAWLAFLAIDSADERERRRKLEATQGPCRDAVVSRTVGSSACPRPEQHLTIEDGLIVCRCETLSRANGDK